MSKIEEIEVVVTVNADASELRRTAAVLLECADRIEGVQAGSSLSTTTCPAELIDKFREIYRVPRGMITGVYEGVGSTPGLTCPADGPVEIPSEEVMPHRLFGAVGPGGGMAWRCGVIGAVRLGNSPVYPIAVAVAEGPLSR